MAKLLNRGGSSGSTDPNPNRLQPATLALTPVILITTNYIIYIIIDYKHWNIFFVVSLECFEICYIKRPMAAPRHPQAQTMNNSAYANREYSFYEPHQGTRTTQIVYTTK